MSSRLKLEPVMVLPQRGPKIVADTAKVYTPGHSVRLGMDLLVTAIGTVPMQASKIRWVLHVSRDRKEVHLSYVSNTDKEDHPTVVGSWRSGTKSKSIMVNIRPALRVLGISAYDAIGLYKAEASKDKIVIQMAKKIDKE